MHRFAELIRESPVDSVGFIDKNPTFGRKTPKSSRHNGLEWSDFRT